MNGAESLVRTLVEGGVEVCFANPGTSEMHFVAALDSVPGIRCVLCLFEGGATGAADGYARMAGKPVATLLHLGSGLGNGIANLHNAKKANSSIVNIVGDHATYHRQYDSPMTMDIETLARPVSGWIRTTRDVSMVGADAADAIAAALAPPGQVATLILAADASWNEGGKVAALSRAAPAPVSAAAVDAAAQVLRAGDAVLLLGGLALREAGLKLAGAIGAKTGARVLAQGPNARIERGAGRVWVDRIPNGIDAALAMLKGTKRIVLVGADAPISQFAYPGKPSRLAPPECKFTTLAEPGEDLIGALTALAEAVGADLRMAPVQELARPNLPSGSFSLDKIGAALCALLPVNAVVADESVSTGVGLFRQTRSAPPHDWLQITGGAIGSGIPMATGAAIACPDRKVINLEADGSGMYTVQSLWTQARLGLDILTVVWSNRSYAVLRQELKNVGVQNPGRTALDMLSLGNPDLDWVKLANSMGVEGIKATNMDDFAQAFRRGLSQRGPFLVEAVL